MNQEPKVYSPWLSTEELASYTHLSVGYLRRLRAEGRGPRAIVLGRGLKFHRDEVDRWMNQYMQEQPATLKREAEEVV